MKRKFLSLITAGLILSLAGCATTQLQKHDAKLDAQRAETVEYRYVTGSRIRQRVDKDRPVDFYTSFPVTAYSRDDLERTGQGDAREALRILQPGLF